VVTVNKQKGFSLVEGLLLVVVISIVGFGGWYVSTQADDSDTVQTVSETTNATIVEDENNKELDPKLVDPEESTPVGFKEYSDSQFSFLYPEVWTTSKDDTIKLKSTDYDVEILPNRTNLISGAEIEIYRQPNFYKTVSLGVEEIIDTVPELIDFVKEAAYARTDAVSTEISGYEGVYFTCGHTDTYYCYDLVIEGELVQIRSRPVSDTQEIILTSLINSLKIK
jgi:hypothetical protein